MIDDVSERATVSTPIGEPRRTAVLVALSPLADDPRVRRMGDYLHANGWRVIGFGLPGAQSAPPEWTIHCGSQEMIVAEDSEIASQAAASTPASTTMSRGNVDKLPRLRDVIGKLLTAPRSLGRSDRATLVAFLRGIAGGIWRPLKATAMWVIAGVARVVAISIALVLSPFAKGPSQIFWRASHALATPRTGVDRLLNYYNLYRRVRIKGDAADDEIFRQSVALRSIERAALEHGEAGLWIANDWLVMPIVSRAVDKFGGASAYDSHEYATEEYVERLDWRIFQQPLVRTIERRHIARAAVVTSVSAGITDALKSRYGLVVPTATLRNLPQYEKHPYREVGERIRFLYHGVVAPGRGLLETIESVRLWQPDTELVIRGPGAPEFITKLRSHVAECEVSDRVRIEPPIPTTELVRAATGFDVGMMALPGHSAHNRFALPNKVFEYLMAGLAICVSDLPAMANVVEESGAGILIADTTPESIALAVNSLDRGRVNQMKKHALEAAKSLHFDADAEAVAALYEQVIRKIPGLNTTAATAH